MFGLFLTICSSTNRSNYRTCEQSRFCARNRNLPPQGWQLLPGSEILTPTNFTTLINDTTYSEVLQLTVTFLSCGAVHFQILPFCSESFPRFTLSAEQTVVDQKVLSSTATFTFSDTGDSISLKTAQQTVEIRKLPFAIFFSDSSHRRIAINSADTAIFETNRSPDTHPQLFEPINFNGHLDSIPNGPTSVAIDIEYLSPSIRLTGLPGHTLPLTLPQTVGFSDPIRFFNTDHEHFEIGNGLSLYGAVPFIFAHSPTGCDGVFWCNPSETWVDITTTKTRFISEGGYIDFFIFSGPQSSISSIFTTLTGRPQLIPLFGLGFHQCRWGYLTADEIRKVSADLDAISVPHDVFWLDLDYTDRRRYFHFHPTNFPNPELLLADLNTNLRKLVVLIDPHLHNDESYDVYAEARDLDLFLKNTDGTPYVGECWPGQSSWPDFLNPNARSWWETLFDFNKFTVSRSNLHIWNDMNEISAFGSPEGTAPRDLKHFNGIEEREVHNLYGHLMISATFGGMVKRDNLRPFILTRSYFAGSQKYAAVWTGDNTAEWPFLRNSVALVLTFGLSGIIYSGSDVGGFFKSPNPELLSSWCLVIPFF
jgi:alpha 1,3-glucosidase